MKKLSKKEGIMYFNRYNGNYGNCIYLPDNVDAFEWIELPEEEVRKYEKDKNDIYNITIKEIDKQLNFYKNNNISTYARDINIDDLKITDNDIEIDDSIFNDLYTIDKLFANNNIHLYTKHGDIKQLIEQKLEEFNANVKNEIRNNIENNIENETQNNNIFTNTEIQDAEIIEE